MFLKGYTNANPDKTTNARAARVEVFNGQDTRDGVNILIMGTDAESVKIVLRRGLTLLWY